MAEVNNFASKVEFGNRILKLIKKAKEVKVDYKLLHSYEKKIKNVSVEAIEQRVHKYASDPLKLRKSLTPTIHAYIGNFIGYLTELQKLWEVMIPIAIEIDRVEYSDEQDTEKIIQNWIHRAQAEHGGSIFTDNMIKRLEKTYESFTEKLEKEIKQDFKNERRELKGKEPKGLFLRMKSDKKLIREIRRLTRKVRKEDLKFEKEKKALFDQLNSTIELNFIDLFDRYLDDEGKLDHLLNTIKKEVEEEAYHLVEEEYERTAQTNSVTKLIIHNYPDIAKRSPHFDLLEDALQNTNKYKLELFKMSKIEMKDDRVLLNGWQHQEAEFQALLEQLHKISASREVEPAHL